MAVTLLTTDDIRILENKVDILIEKLSETRPNGADRLLRSREICERLNIKYPTFKKRIPLLIPFGLKKEGGWCISESGLKKYMNHLSK